MMVTVLTVVTVEAIVSEVPILTLHPYAFSAGVRNTPAYLGPASTMSDSDILVTKVPSRLLYWRNKVVIIGGQQYTQMEVYTDQGCFVSLEQQKNYSLWPFDISHNNFCQGIHFQRILR